MVVFSQPLLYLLFVCSAEVRIVASRLLYVGVRVDDAPFAGVLVGYPDSIHLPSRLQRMGRVGFQPKFVKLVGVTEEERVRPSRDTATDACDVAQFNDGRMGVEVEV